VNTRCVHCKPGLLLLLSAGVIACAGATLNVDYRQAVHGWLRAVGINGTRHSPAAVREIVVAAGNELTVDGRTHTLTPIAPDELAKRLAWAGGLFEQDGWLKFRGQSLAIVAAEFNRHNRRKLRIGDPRTARLAVGGKFRVNDLDGFVAALGLTHGVRATLSEPGRRFDPVITLSGGNSAPTAEMPGAPEHDPTRP
jgi:ferric-dicitrate binding protein FerR (iron transport regulator)